MPGSLGVILGVSTAKSGVTLACMIAGNAGTPITQATLSSIAWKVTRYQVDGKTVDLATGSGSLTISAVVFDTPQTTDPRYDIADGYNFLATLPASAFQVGGYRHRIAITFVPVSGEQFTQVADTTPEEVP
jgi:hypothetical protein